MSSGPSSLATLGKRVIPYHAHKTHPTLFTRLPRKPILNPVAAGFKSTKQPEVCFRALLTYGAQAVRFERVAVGPT
jgi:hypothetical protein